jgi:AcrR family transcriptional regulator
MMTALTDTHGQSDTRERLIDAVLVVVARNGLGGANVKAIAREAGITPGLLHYHFATKDEVLFAAVDRAGRAYIAALDELIDTHSAEGLFDAYLAFALGSLQEHRPLFALRFALAIRAINDPQTAARLAEGDAEVSRRLATIVACRAARCAPNEDDRIEARMIKAAFEGMMLSWLSRPDFPMEPALKRFAAQVRASHQ